MNRVVHFEIHASDVEAMKKFYSSVFGWEMKQMGPEMGNYVLVDTGKDAPGAKWPGISGGMMARNAPKAPEGVGPNAWVCTVSVENLDATLEKAKTAGGTMAMDKMNVPGVGDLAYMKDPDGNLFGVLQPAISAQQ